MPAQSIAVLMAAESTRRHLTEPRPDAVAPRRRLAHTLVRAAQRLDPQLAPTARPAV